MESDHMAQLAMRHMVFDCTGEGGEEPRPSEIVAVFGLLFLVQILRAMFDG